MVFCDTTSDSRRSDYQALSKPDPGLHRANALTSGRMREALFTVRRTADGGLCAKNNVLRLSVAARSREELKEEAREALISAVGPSHVGYRIRLQSESQPQSVPA